MNEERWTLVDRLLGEALECEPGKRAAFLREACGDDEALRLDVESLVMHAATGSALGTPEPAGALLGSRAVIVGRQIGQYTIEAPLGAGGMGEVYRARDGTLGRDVAIKILPRSFSADPDRRARFDREARLLAALNHPHIGAIYGVDDSGGVRALVLELVDGDTLAERIARGPIPIKEALRVAGQIADALDAAHGKGIVHRDLKPANIKITPEGTVKVLDFGLAKAVIGDTTGLDLTQSSEVTVGGTRQGMILGTAAYMSPEQTRGKPIDKRTDVWAFGCVLYEMLTGRLAFPGETVSDTIGAILEREPDWKALPAASGRVRPLVRWCLEKDPQRRVRDIGDVRRQIDDVISGGSEENPPAPVSRPLPAWRRALPWASTVLACVALMGVLAWPTASTPPASETRLHSTVPATSDPGSIALSPDGLQFVYVKSEETAPRLWLQSLNEDAPQPLAGTAGASRPFWSPDSRSVAFFAANKLQRIDINGGLPRTVVKDTGVLNNGGSWSANNVILFAGTRGRLFRIDANAIEGEAVAQTMPDGSRQHQHLFPRFLPDGRQFLFFSSGQSDSQGIYLGSLDSMETTLLRPADTGGAYLAPGWVIFVRHGRLVAQQLNVANRALIGELVTVADSVAFDLGLSVGDFSVSSTGLVAYRDLGVSQLTWVDRSGKGVGTLGGLDRNNLGTVELSPDGTRVATGRNVEGNQDVYLLDAAGGKTPFTFNPDIDWFPIWYPQGESRLVFNTRQNGFWELHEKPSSAAGSEQPFMNWAGHPPAPGGQPNDFSRKGDFLLFQRFDGLRVQPLDPNGKPSQKPFEFSTPGDGARWGQFSPDQRWVAYQMIRSGRTEIFLQPFQRPGGPIQISTSGGIQARWAPEGKEVFYIAPDGTMMAVRVQEQGDSIEHEIPERLFQTRIHGGGTAGVLYKQNYDVAPDGRFLINVDIEGVADIPVTLIQNWKPPAN